MTIVAAMKFDERICVMSDTMISSAGVARDNIIPGRLKSIVINQWLTISYAGLSTQAIDAIRKIYNTSNITTEWVLKYLIVVSSQYSDELDFIVCSHENGVRLVKVSNGRISEGAKAYWIGSVQAANELSRVTIPNNEIEGLPDYMSVEEVIFKNAFNTYMRENRCTGIGGAIIDCLCSPYGHCFNTHAASFSWDTIVLGRDDFDERQEKNRTGMYHYEYHVSSTSARGQSVVGFYLDQAKLGFIYDPIHYDEAMKIESIGLSEFSRLVDDAGKVLSLKMHNNSSKRDAVTGAPS
jgi:hypothetical protein